LVSCVTESKSQGHPFDILYAAKVAQGGCKDGDITTETEVNSRYLGIRKKPGEKTMIVDTQAWILEKKSKKGEEDGLKYFRGRR